MAVAGSALFLLAACGTDNGSATGAGASPPRSPRPVSSSPSSSPSPTESDCTPEKAHTLTAAANRETVCVAEGGRVDIVLDGTTARPWAAVQASGSALTAVNVGIAPPTGGDAASGYKATSPGKVTLTSTRPLCAKAKPGQMSCKGLQVWTATVVVSDGSTS
jgi:hypothetical protein